MSKTPRVTPATSNEDFDPTIPKLPESSDLALEAVASVPQPFPGMDAPPPAFPEAPAVEAHYPLDLFFAIDNIRPDQAAGFRHAIRAEHQVRTLPQWRAAKAAYDATPIRG